MSASAAFFDFDGTLTKKNAIEHYLHLISQNLSLINRCFLVVKIFLFIPYYFIIYRINRELFNQVFYRNYRQYSCKEMNDRSQKYFQSKLQHNIFADAKHCIAEHKQQGHLLILVTGSLDFIAKPLADFMGFDAVLATGLKTKQEYYTGEIKGVSLQGEEKATAIKKIAQELDIDLSQSFAYGDSLSDLAMLETVGNSIVVNPSQKLRKIAQQRGWRINTWN